MPRRLVLILAVLAIAGAAAGAWLARRPPIVHLRIGTAAEVISAPVWVASAFGDFARERLDVTVVPYASGRLALEAMYAGEVDLATVAETPLWRQAREGRPLVLWATLAETRRSEWIIARGDKGIAGPADVVGRRIAVPRGTTAEIYLLAFLDLYGIDRSRVEIIDIKPQDIATELAEGTVDVACVWEPYGSKVPAALAHPVLMHDDFIYRMTWNLVGRSDRPGLPIGRVLRAIDRADRRVLADDPRVVAGISRWCTLEPELVRRMIPDHHYALQLEGSLLTEIEEQVKLCDGPAATPPDILDLIDTRPLESVLPEAVSVPTRDAR